MKNIQVLRVAYSGWTLISKQSGIYLLQVQEGVINFAATSNSTTRPAPLDEGRVLDPLIISTVSGNLWVKGTGRILLGEFTSAAEASLFSSLYSVLQQAFMVSQGGAVASVNGQTGEVTLSYADVGAEQAGTANGLMTSHVEASDPHGDRAYFDGYINDFLIPGFSSALAAKAAVESPAFIGEPTAPTAPLNNNSDIIANTAFVQQALANVLTGVWKDQGNFDASSGAWPTSANTIDLGLPKAGYLWKVSVGGTLAGGVVVNAGDIIRALVDNPSNSATDWAANESNLGYVPENQANKQTSLASPNNTTFPTTQAVANALASLLSAAALRYTFNPQSGTSYSVAAADVTSTGTVIVICANASPVAVTLATPTALLGGVAADHAGKSTNIRQGGSGIVTVTGSLVGNGVFLAQHETKTFIAQADNTWLVVGG